MSIEFCCLTHLPPNPSFPVYFSPFSSLSTSFSPVYPFTPLLLSPCFYFSSLLLLIHSLFHSFFPSFSSTPSDEADQGTHDFRKHLRRTPRGDHVREMQDRAGAAGDGVFNFQVGLFACVCVCLFMCVLLACVLY